MKGEKVDSANNDDFKGNSVLGSTFLKHFGKFWFHIPHVKSGPGFFLLRIHSMHVWTSTKRHGVTKKKEEKKQ